MRFAADENFNGVLLNRLLARLPGLSVIRIQDTEMYQRPDPEVLAWAAAQDRIILTHDLKTLVPDAIRRVRDGLPMPGVVWVENMTDTNRALNDLEVTLGAGGKEDFNNQVIYLPYPSSPDP